MSKTKTTKPQVYWRNGARVNVDAETFHAEMERIRQRKDGELQPSDIVSEARKKTNPLHGEFEWDDSKAAQIQRETRARTMIGYLVIRHPHTPHVQARVYEGVTSTTATQRDRQQQKQVFRSHEEILADPEMRAELLARAFAEMRSFVTRYKGLSELAPVFEGIGEALQKHGEAV